MAGQHEEAGFSRRAAVVVGVSRPAATLLISIALAASVAAQGQPPAAGRGAGGPPPGGGTTLVNTRIGHQRPPVCSGHRTHPAMSGNHRLRVNPPPSCG